jgi:hypothetical protein
MEIALIRRWSKECLEIYVGIKLSVNEDKTQGIYLSHSRRPPLSRLTLNGKVIPFVNSIKYLGVIFDKKIT